MQRTMLPKVRYLTLTVFTAQPEFRDGRIKGSLSRLQYRQHPSGIGVSRSREIKTVGMTYPDTIMPEKLMDTEGDLTSHQGAAGSSF